MSPFEPVLKPTPIAEIRPTQITIGLREVEQKRKRFADLGLQSGGAFLGRHTIPVVLGHKGRRYAIDHHHLVRALHDEGVTLVLTSVQADLSALSKAAFWTFLDNRNWCHPYDAKGERKDFAAIPRAFAALEDDPYRSLAGALRQAGGYAKDLTPFSEFLWADFLRRRVKRRSVVATFDTALERAVALARSPAAAFLPGWCGPHLAG